MRNLVGVVVEVKGKSKTTGKGWKAVLGILRLLFRGSLKRIHAEIPLEQACVYRFINSCSPKRRRRFAATIQEIHNGPSRLPYFLIH